MTFERLLAVVGDEPVFESALLLAGEVDARDVRRQLSRWVTAGKLFRLRRGLYALAPPYQKRVPHPYLVANRLVHPSYVSLQSALGHYGLIPEYVPVATSVTTMRPGRFDTPLGGYLFRHLKRELLFGYDLVALAADQQAFVATPEKALLDLLHLESGADASGYLQELRLQNLGSLDLARLAEWATRYPGTRLLRAADVVRELARSEAEEYEVT